MQRISFDRRSVGPGSRAAHCLGGGYMDGDLAAAARTGGTQAGRRAAEGELRAYLEDHIDELRRRAVRLTRNKDEANDLVQETVAKALVALPSYRPGSNIRLWLFRIMYTKFVDGCRRRARERTSTGEAEELDLPGPVEAATDEAPPAWANLTLDQVASAMQALPDAYRQAYEAFTVHDRSYEAIATELQIPKNTVATRIRRARLKLRELLGPLVGRAEGGDS